MSIFQILFKNEYEKKRMLMEKINECNIKLKDMDTILKKRWEKWVNVCLCLSNRLKIYFFD
jgi:hypothetical protein